MIVWLTLALVLITGYYAYQTRAAVKEMQESRRLSVLPDLRADMHIASIGRFVTFSITNTGQGPAIDVDVRLIYKAGRSVAGTTNERTWRTYTMTPGERHEFYPPKVDPDHRTRIDELINKYQEFRVVGEIKDSLGRTHDVSLTLDNFAEYRDIQAKSGHAFTTAPLERIANGVAGIDRALHSANASLGLISRASERAYPPPPSAPEQEDVPF